MKNYKDFFDNYGDCRFEECQHPFETFSIDQLYHFFKERLIAELLVNDVNSPTFGKLFDSSDL